MKTIKTHLSVAFIVLISTLSFAQNDWENSEIFQQNREKAHATFNAYSSIEKAIKNEISENEYAKILNGIWKFNYVGHASERPTDFYKTDFDTSDWDYTEFFKSPSDLHLCSLWFYIKIQHPVN